MWAVVKVNNAFQSLFWEFFLSSCNFSKHIFVPTKSNFWTGGELTGELAENERAKRTTQQENNGRTDWLAASHYREHQKNPIP